MYPAVKTYLAIWKACEIKVLLTFILSKKTVTNSAYRGKIR